MLSFARRRYYGTDSETRTRTYHVTYTSSAGAVFTFDVGLKVGDVFRTDDHAEAGRDAEMFEQILRKVAGLVAAQAELPKVNSLLSGTFHEIRERLKFVDISKVEELYSRKKAYRQLEDTLGIA